jgi:hypothetical protein
MKMGLPLRFRTLTFIRMHGHWPTYTRASADLDTVRCECGWEAAHPDTMALDRQHHEHMRRVRAEQ